MLELFDLDEAFSSEKVRLAQLTNKCKLTLFTIHWLVVFSPIIGIAFVHQDFVMSVLLVLSSSLPGTDDDLEFYVRKCGEILGVTAKLDKDQRDAKHILEHIFFQIVEFKKLNQVS